MIEVALAGIVYFFGALVRFILVGGIDVWVVVLCILGVIIVSISWMIKEENNAIGCCESEP